MGKRATISEVSTLTGLSEYALRKGIREGRYPHIRTGIGSGKILVDIELLEEYLAQEARDNAAYGQSEAVKYGQLRKVKA